MQDDGRDALTVAVLLPVAVAHVEPAGGEGRGAHPSIMVGRPGSGYEAVMAAPRRVKKYRKGYAMRMGVLATLFVVGVLIMILSRYDVIPARPWGYVGLAAAAVSAILGLISTVVEARNESELESSPENARRMNEEDARD